MPEQPPSGPSPASAIQADLRQLSRILRDARHLGPDAQRELAQLVDELGGALAAGALSADQTAHLSETLAHLSQAVRRPDDKGLLAAARKRLEDVAVRIEEGAPAVVDIVRRFLDALANLGI
jgi:hypothetical protein